MHKRTMQKQHILSRRNILKVSLAGLSLGALLPFFPAQAWAAGEGAAKKKLVVYFSLPETNTATDMTKEQANSTVVIGGQVLGNTQYVARVIQKHVGADIFRIEAKKPYPLDHSTLVDLGEVEKRDKVRPELAAALPNMDEYNVLFLGYPNWYADMPMILYTFLEGCDLSGKTIVPFITHGGSGFSRTIASIAAVQPQATVEKNGFSISRNAVENCEPDVVSWLQKLGY